MSIDWPITRLAVFITEDDCFNMLPGSARYVMFEKLFSVIREDKDAPHMTTRHNAAVWVRFTLVIVTGIKVEFFKSKINLDLIT